MPFYFYLAFKTSYVFNPKTFWSWMPRSLNPHTIVHVELIISQPCKGKGCDLCAKSKSQATRDKKHWLSWFVSIKDNWQLVVDERKHVFNKAFSYKYVAIPLKNEEKLLVFMNSLIGKNMNVLGLINNRFLMFSGIRKNDPKAHLAQKYYCSEAIAVALEYQGYERFLTKNPGSTSPEQLFQDCQKIPISSVQNHHPNNMQL